MSTRAELDAPSVAGPRNLTLAHLLVLAIGTFTLGVDGYVLAGLVPEVAVDLRVSISAAGQLTALFAIVYAVGSPVIAALTGSWDRRVLLVGGMVVFVGGLVVQAAGPNFATVAAGRVVAALGAAAYQANAFSTAGLLSDDAHRARALAVVAGGGSLALVAGLPFGILAGHAWGWRTAVWILVVPAVIAGCAVAFLPPAHAPRLSLGDRLRILTDARVRAILLGTVTVIVPAFLLIAYLPTVLDVSGTLVVAAMLAFGCGQVIGTTIVARLIHRRGAPCTLTLGAAGVAVAAVLLAAARTTTLGAVVAMIGLGISVGISIVPQQHRFFALVPAIAPIAMGLNGSAVYLAVALGAGLGGGALALAGAVALAPTAAVLGLLAVTVALAVRPEDRGR
ncbi:MFS transporter [Nocardia sp. NPDC050718]|uniref:MFS transporter n=1 Tax=Nocardia sp. NPDC050718 TaxID=3155788 RepID=UPI00340886E4